MNNPLQNLIQACEQKDYDNFVLLLTEDIASQGKTSAVLAKYRKLFTFLAKQFINKKIDFKFIQELVSRVNVSAAISSNKDLFDNFLDHLSSPQLILLLSVPSIYRSLKSEAILGRLLVGGYNRIHNASELIQHGWFVDLVKAYPYKAIVLSAKHYDNCFDSIVSVVENPDEFFAKINFDSITMFSNHVIRRMFSSDFMKGNVSAVKKIFYKSIIAYNVEILTEITAYSCFNESILDSATFIPALEKLMTISSGSSVGLSYKEFDLRKEATIRFLLGFKVFLDYAQSKRSSFEPYMSEPAEVEVQTTNQSHDVDVITSKKIRLTTTPENVPNQGIDNKYLGGRLPAMPDSFDEDSDSDESDELILKHDSEYKFISLSDLPHTKDKNLTSIICKDTLAVFDFYSNDSFINSEDLARDLSVVFVFAGRKQEALFPKPSAKCKVILVATQDEYFGYKHQVPDMVDVLVIKSINSPTHGDYTPVIGTLNARRLAALIFSQYLNLNHCLFLDDNIKSLPYNACEIDGAQTNSLEFDGIYNFFLTAKKDYNNPVIFGAATISNRIKNDYSNIFCAKLHFWDIEALRSKNIVGNNLSFLAYPALYSRFWGEDYLQHLMLRLLFEQEDRAAFNTIDANIMGYIRSKKFSNSCLKSVSPMQALMDADVLASINASQEFDLRIKADSAVSTLKLIIKDNIGRYNNRAKIRTDANLLEVHAQANGIAFQINAKNANINKSDNFLTDWIQALSNNLSNMQSILLPHQINAISAIINAKCRHAGLTMATGSGKTMLQIALALTALQNNTGRPITIVTASQNLVQQFYDDFKNAWPKYLDLFPDLDFNQIIKVMSGGNNINVGLLLMNQPIKTQNFIAIYCVDSYMQMLKHEAQLNNGKFFTKHALLLLDEYHLYSETQLKAILKSSAINFHGAGYGFTATPPKHLNKFTACIYDYDLSMALKDKIVSPIKLNKLDYAYNRKKVDGLLSTLYKKLCDTNHPNGGKLIEHKVLIYLARIKDIQKLADIFQQHQIKVFQLHTKNENNHAHLEEFRQYQSHCIGLACGQLRVGYSDIYLDTVLYLRNGNDSLDVAQVAGRLMRVNKDKPEKTGYMLTFSDAITTEFDTNTDIATAVEQTKILRFSSSNVNNSSYLASSTNGISNNEVTQEKQRSKSTSFLRF